jgi:hypothetical protein
LTDLTGYLTPHLTGYLTDEKRYLTADNHLKTPHIPLV